MNYRFRHTPTGRADLCLRACGNGRYPGSILFSEILQKGLGHSQDGRLSGGDGFIVAVPAVYHALCGAGLGGDGL